MYNFFSDLFNALNQTDNHIIIMAVFLGIAALVVLLRIISHIHFRAALISFRQDTKKPIEKFEDVRKLKSSLLINVVVEYKKVADKAVTHVPASQLVNRQVATMSFLGWRYEGMLPFVIELEKAILWIGLILAFVFSDYAFVYGVLAVVLFLLVRAAAAFFDFSGAREQLRDEILIYVERELGRFFASDTGGAVLRLKDDLKESMASMTNSLEEIMTGMAESLASTTDSIGKTMAQTATDIGKTMIEATSSVGPALAAAIDEKLINMNAELAITLESWKETLTKAVDLQTEMNSTSDRLGQSSLRLQSSSELLAKHLQGHSNALSEQLVALVLAIEGVKEGVSTLSTQQDALVQQSGYIERNQQTLEASLQAYESSLQELTQSLGDGLGAFINLHAQTSAQTVNDALKSGLDKLILLANKSGESN
ncbi:MAG: hypothetical protein FWE11_04540 [Defluviitaleaceae bacterium]|nr:hypothetical protein [Defluviitaleaceae bacterium]